MTHYVPAFSARAICGEFGEHALEPDCPDCVSRISVERELAIEDNLWNAVPLPPDVEEMLSQPIPSSRCLDGSTANCMPSDADLTRCRSCRRELL